MANLLILIFERDCPAYLLGLAKTRKSESQVYGAQWIRQISFIFFWSFVYAAFSNAGEITCGNVRIKLVCEEDRAITTASDCKETSLKFIPAPNTKKRTVALRRASSSNWHLNKIPIEATCLKNAEGQSYVLVQFGTGALDCVSCSIFDLFTSDGVRLTKLGRNLDHEISTRKLIENMTDAPRVRIDN